MVVLFTNHITSFIATEKRLKVLNQMYLLYYVLILVHVLVKSSNWPLLQNFRKLLALYQFYLQYRIGQPISKMIPMPENG